MEKEYTQDEIQEAYDDFKEDDKLTELERLAPILKGKSFYSLKKNESFEKVGTSIQDWFGEKGENYKTRSGHEGVYTAFCLVGKFEPEDLAEIQINRLLKLKSALFKSHRGKLPTLKVTEDELEEWVEKAKILSITDFSLEFNQTFKDFKDPSSCKHPNAKLHAYQSCPECGERIWVDPETKEPIKHWH